MQWQTDLDREEDDRWRREPSRIDVVVDADRLRETTGATLDEATARLRVAMSSRYPDARVDVTAQQGRWPAGHHVESDARVPHCYDVELSVHAALGDPW